MSPSRVFVITGASTGIGAATARLAVDEGHRVVLAARSADRLGELASALGADHALAVPTDVTDFAAQERLVAAALERFGTVDVVFANAGFGAQRGFLADSPGHWRDTVLTNVLGAAYTIRATLPALRASRGHLVLTSSGAGRIVLAGSLYSATKHAVTAMAEALRLEVDGALRVTCLEPGIVDTPFFDANAPDWALAPDDIARAVLWVTDQPAQVDVNEILIRPTAQAE